MDFAHFCGVMFELQQMVLREATKTVTAIEDEVRQMRVHQKLLRSDEYKVHTQAMLGWLKLRFQADYEDKAFQVLIKQFSDKDLARAFGVSRPTVQRWRTGQNAPHPALMERACETLRQMLVNR